MVSLCFRSQVQVQFQSEAQVRVQGLWPMGATAEGTGKDCAANPAFVSESECGRPRCGCGDFQVTLEQRRGQDMEVRSLCK